MTCAIDGKNGSDILIDGKNCGLKASLQYQVEGLLTPSTIIDQVTQQKLVLICLRRPYGKGSWSGAWGPISEEMTVYGSELSTYVQDLPIKRKLANEEVFCMRFDDWRDMFSAVTVNTTRDSHWQ